MVCGVCVVCGRVWGGCGVCVGACGGVRALGGDVGGLGVVGRAWGVCGGAIRVGIARSALLSGYLGKSGHLPRFYFEFQQNDVYS